MGTGEDGSLVLVIPRMRSIDFQPWRGHITSFALLAILVKYLGHRNYNLAGSILLLHFLRYFFALPKYLKMILVSLLIVSFMFETLPEIDNLK